MLGLPEAWVLLCPSAPGDGCSSTAPLGDAVRAEFLAGLDATRPVAAVAVEGLVLRAAEQVFASDELVRGLALVLSGGERGDRPLVPRHGVGIRQGGSVGRPIGQFQAVKHAVADMLVAVEQRAAVGWDAASAWNEEDATGRAVGRWRPPGRVHRRLGRTPRRGALRQAVRADAGWHWVHLEHDAHLYLKRAVSDLQLLAGGDAGALEQEVTALAVAGVRRELRAASCLRRRNRCGPMSGSWSSRWQRRRRGPSAAKRWPRPV